LITKIRDRGRRRRLGEVVNIPIIETRNGVTHGVGGGLRIVITGMDVNHSLPFTEIRWSNGESVP